MTQIDNTVRGALTGRTPVVVGSEDTVRHAAVILSHNQIGAVPVVVHGRLIGILTERDILQKVVAAARDPDVLRVADAMTRDPKTITAETSLVEAISLMTEGKFRHLPVVDAEGQVISVLSMRDMPLPNQIMHRNWRSWTGDKQLTACAAE